MDPTQERHAHDPHSPPPNLPLGGGGVWQNILPPILLASTSPRRAQLLAEAGYRFRQVAPTFDEERADIAGLSPRQITESFAAAKAASVADEHADALILASDTVVVVDDAILGKPADAADARRMIQLLQGRTHEVLTSVCLLRRSGGVKQVWTETATVTIEPLSEETIERYIASGQWRGKAGGYNLAELAHAWRCTVTGDPTTVIGLPMQRLGEVLRSEASSRASR